MYDSNPDTFEAWLSQAEAAHGSSGDINGFLALNGETNIGSTAGFQLVWSAGAQMFAGESGDIEVVLDQGDNREKVANALEWYQQIHEFSPDAIDWGWGDSYSALAQESVAAAPGLGSDPALTVRNNNDEISDSVSGSLPPRAEGTEPPIFQYVQGHIIHGESDSPEEAKEFVKYFHESEHYFEWLASSPMYLLPFNKDQMDNEAFTENEFISEHSDMWDLYRENWDRFQLLEDTSDGEEPNLVAANAYNEQVLGRMLSEAVVNDGEPGAVVDETADRLRELME
jgi:multiple sugar transport system substrate-binding protein